MSVMSVYRRVEYTWSCMSMVEARLTWCFVDVDKGTMKRNEGSRLHLRASGGRTTLGRSDGRVDLLAVLVVANAHGRVAVATALARTDTHDVSVDGARDTVVDLEVQLGERVLCKGWAACEHSASLTVVGTVCKRFGARVYANDTAVGRGMLC